MAEKRYELVRDYDCDGEWEYAYQNNETGRRYNFADECCHDDFLNDVNSSYEQLKQQIRIFEKFLEHNDLSIEWENFCTATDCPYDDDNYRMCQECHYLKW